MHSILYELALLIVLSILSKVSAFWTCWPAAPHDLPIPADCIRVAAHIPFIPVPVDEGPNHVPPLYSYNLPFFPSAVLHHGSCVVRVSYQDWFPTPSKEFDFVWEAHWTNNKSPTVPLSERSIISLWRAVRASLHYIATRCIAHGRVGFAGGAVHIREMEQTTVLVEILDRSKRSYMEEYIREGRMALRGRSRSHRAMGGGIPNKFEMAAIQVP